MSSIKFLILLSNKHKPLVANILPIGMMGGIFNVANNKIL